jgi:hypothetical protein
MLNRQKKINSSFDTPKSIKLMIGHLAKFSFEKLFEDRTTDINNLI